ncbi:hypothetical protein [Nocardia fluminea]|uniref:hypothetical protein n=1 Tax=Nocardia fluminea TaxID=134984 RepID=UPI00340FDF7D
MRHECSRYDARTDVAPGRLWGIGAAYAWLLSPEHALVARRTVRLNELAMELRTTGATVEVLPADLTTPVARRR